MIIVPIRLRSDEERKAYLQGYKAGLQSKPELDIMMLKWVEDELAHYGPTVSELAEESH